MPCEFVSVYKVTGLPSFVPKGFCSTPDLCFDGLVCARSIPLVARRKIKRHAVKRRLGIMAKSVLRRRAFVI
jgi:hypothetical protein